MTTSAMLKIHFPYVKINTLNNLNEFLKSEENKIPNNLCRGGGGDRYYFCIIEKISLSMVCDESKDIALAITLTLVDGYHSNIFKDGFYQYVSVRDNFFKKISEIIGDDHPLRD
ncbi:MAG: hypothetical protein WAV31_06560 [Candidatus Moraniibacteriota bacterium]